MRREAFSGLGRLYRRANPIGDQAAKTPQPVDDTARQLLCAVPIRLFKSYVHPNIEDRCATADATCRQPVCLSLSYAVCTLE